MKKAFAGRNLLLLALLVLTATLLFAGPLDQVGTNVSGKIKELLGPLKMIGLAIAGIGGVWFAVKIIKGDNDAWEYAGKILIGGGILASAAQIFDWFITF